VSIQTPSPGEINTPPETLYWKALDVGKALQCSEKTVYRIAQQDPTFPMVKIGGLVRFPRERVLRWIRDREQGSGSRRLGSVAQMSRGQA
jgi:predicted DNA-binding transcriptional regulator AlpA